MRFTLAIDQAGRAILATPDQLTAVQIAELQAAFRRWDVAQPPEALIVGECDVVRVLDVELIVDTPTKAIPA